MLATAFAEWEKTGKQYSGCAVLVRHGATLWNADRRLQGQIDVPLSPLGMAQVAETAAAIAAVMQPACIYTSPLGRALVTGQAIAKATHAKVQTCSELVERAFGAMEGLTITEANQQFPNRRQDESSVPGMEPFAHLQKRAVEAVESILIRHPGQPVVIVSHGGFINAFLAATSQGRVGSGVTNLANGGISVVWQAPAGWHIGALNIYEHLTEPTGQTQPSTIGR